MMFKKYILFLFFGIIFSKNLFSQPCAGDIDFTLSPPPSASNTYPPGATVQVCVTMVGWPGTNNGANWLEGFGLNLGDGWTTVTPVTFPDDCGGADPTYTWLFVNSVTSSATGNTAGPGFFYEGPAGPTDGDPGNDFGDSGGLECTWEFCVDLTASATPGADLSLSVSVYSDGDMGSWGNTACVGVDPPEEITPGTITDTCIYGCVNFSACNFNPEANCENGSCITPSCGDSTACNYDANASCFDNTLCIPAGCIDPIACNFDASAECDDNSCEFLNDSPIISSNNYDTVCVGVEIIYSVADSSNTSTYIWNVDGGDIVLPDQSNICKVLWGNVSGTYSVTVQETTESGCVGPIKVFDVVVVIPNIIFESKSYTICLDETLPLSAMPAFGQWESEYMVGNSFVGTMAGSFSVGYTAEMYDCSVKDYITVNVKSKFEKPIITKADTLVDLCEDANKQFYSVQRKDGIIYVWNVEDVLSVNETNEIAVVWYDTTTNYLVSVYGVDTLNCKSEKSEFFVRTIACSRVYAPNSFTPDNDGVNDIFRVTGIGIYQPRLVIYDKWGNPFFETNDLRRGWNGDNGTGYYSENGVYNWTIYYKDAQNTPKENSGYIILIR